MEFWKEEEAAKKQEEDEDLEEDQAIGNMLSEIDGYFDNN